MSRFRAPLHRYSALLTAIALVMLATACNASASGVHVQITSPRANATISKGLSVKTRTRTERRRHSISYFLDGKLIAVKHVGARSGAKRVAKLDTNDLSRGRHRLRVVVKVGKLSASTSVFVNLAPETARKTHTTNSEIGNSDPVPVPGSELFPTGNAQDFQLIFADDFDKPAALGTMGSDTDANKIVYTGSSGTKWRTYPKTFLDSYQKRPYRSDQVLSVQNGNLDFWLHNVDGKPAGANPSPVLPSGSQYQTYGRYSARVKVDSPDLSEYYMAWLLWPKSDSDGPSAESDFPEIPLQPGRTGVDAYSHFEPGGIDWSGDRSVDMHGWHTYTQDWTPLVRRYYVDGRLIGTTINPVWSGPERWQLQTETNGNGTHDGHLLVDWVAVYSYAPGTTPAS